MQNFKKVILALSFIFSLPLMAKHQCVSSYSKVYNTEQAYGLQVINFNLQQLRSKITETLSSYKNNPDSLTLRGDIRVLFFKLQSLTRTYEKATDEAVFTKYRQFFKKFEDLYGKVDLQHTLLTQAQKLNEPELVTFYKNSKDQATQTLLAELDKNGFLDPKGKVFDRIEKAFNKFDDWKKPKKDKKQQIKILINEAEQLSEDIKDRKFTNADLELGLHELRRKLRWLVIQVQTLNGLTEYAPEEKMKASTQVYLTELLNSNSHLLESSFLKMRPADIKNPIIIPQNIHAMLSEIVTRIGAEKDKVESALYLLETANQLHFSAERIQILEEKILKMNGIKQQTDPKARVEYYQTIIEQSHILESYIYNLEELNSI